tara:strand:+ start:14 stop:217 length:204 start_codon:yes stop_codon:yes gene_type:complete
VVKRKGKRKVAYSKYGVPKKYDEGNSALAKVIKRISDLYKRGKRVPNSLIARRIKLGKKVLKRRRRK